MASLFRGRPAKPEFVVPPAESREAHAQVAEVEGIDRQLTAAALSPRSESVRLRLDALLDRRLDIRPPRVTQPADVPNVPGRTP